MLGETLQVIKYSAVTHIVVAVAFIFLFWDTSQRAYTVCLAIAVIVPSAAAIVVSCLDRLDESRRAVEDGLKFAAGLAFLIGVAWGTMPVALYAASDHDHKMLVVATAVGMIADVYVLGPTLLVSLAYAAPVIVGSFLGINLPGDRIGGEMSLLLAVYALFVLFSVKGMNKLSVQRIVDRVRISDQNATIGLLLHDFEEGTSDWLWEIDQLGKFRHVSQRVSQAAGQPVAALENAAFGQMFQNEGRPGPLSSGAEAVLAAIGARQPFKDQIVEVASFDSTLCWSVTGKPIYDDVGTFAGYRGVGSDITAARKAEARIAYMAHRDDLTGLANRASFVEAGRHACEAMRTDSAPRGMLYLDLDGFKTVNDTYGHAFGDLLLVEVSKRLRAHAVEPDILGRLGGDEFAILVRDADDDRLKWLASDLLFALGSPFQIDGSIVEIGVSIGIAAAPRDATTLDGLMVKADLALYRAKLEGRSRYRLFVAVYEMQLNAQRALETDLRLAQARGEFTLKYQPLVSLVDGRIVCFEALIRWTCPSRGVISPADFIPTAEAIGLIVPIGQWVLSRACRAAMDWPSNASVAVNISPQHFRRTDFTDDVMVALETSGLPASRLEIEITEGVFLDNSSVAIANLHALRRRGVRIALDDFGTGFSSLKYLVDFPVDKIKIDRSFVTHVVSRHANRAIITAMLALAKDLSIEVTAEGVETIEQVAALRALRCDHIQGYLVSTPVDADQIAGMVRASTTIHSRLDPPLALASSR